MKFVLNKQTGVFVLREDLTSGIKAAARDLADLEGKKLKTLEDVTRAAEKEHNDAVKTKEQKKTEFDQAYARLQKNRNYLLFFKRGSGKRNKVPFSTLEKAKVTALFIEDLKNQKPNQQQVNDYLEELQKYTNIKNNSQLLSSVKQDLNICANYSDEQKQINQQELKGAIDNVKIALAGGELLSLVFDQPELVKVIIWLHKKLCVDYPEKYENIIPLVGEEVDHAVGTLKFLFSKDTVKRLLINSVPVYGTFNMIKSFYIVIKYHNQIPNCNSNAEDTSKDSTQTSGDNGDEEAQTNNTLEEQKEKLKGLIDDYKQVTDKVLEKLEQQNATNFEPSKISYENTIKNANEVYNKNSLEDINKMISSIENSIPLLNNFLKDGTNAVIVAESKNNNKKLLKEYREEINNLLIPHMQKQLGFFNIPNINFIEDQENAKDMVGRTAYYDPNTTDITVYVTNRHPKDIMRSVAHEVIHHAQNERGEFDNLGEMGEGYFQTNPQLHKLEIEAYSSGNDLFRKWEENFRKQRNQNKMVNENNLRAKIRSMIAEEMKNMADEKNEPAKEHDASCECEDCSKKKTLLQNKGVKNIAERVDKEIMPLREWRNMELNSLLLNRFGIVSPQVLGEKKANGSKPDYLDLDGDGNKTEPMKKAAKEAGKGKKTPTKKGKVPPQFLKDKKKDESK